MSSFNKNYLEVYLREFHSKSRQNSESYSKKKCARSVLKKK